MTPSFTAASVIDFAAVYHGHTVRSETYETQENRTIYRSVIIVARRPQIGRIRLRDVLRMHQFQRQAPVSEAGSREIDDVILSAEFIAFSKIHPHTSRIELASIFRSLDSSPSAKR
jgi:hypothetical protein